MKKSHGGPYVQLTLDLFEQQIREVSWPHRDRQEFLAREYAPLAIKLAGTFEIDHNDALSAAFRGLEKAVLCYWERPRKEFTNLAYRVISRFLIDAYRLHKTKERHEVPSTTLCPLEPCIDSEAEMDAVLTRVAFKAFWMTLSHEERLLMRGIAARETWTVIGARLGKNSDGLDVVRQGIRAKLKAFNARSVSVGVKVKVQIGVESFDGSKRVFRATPYDKTHEAGDMGELALLFAQMLDAGDSQPGDGEIDIPLGKATDGLVSKLGFLKNINLPGEENVFVRLRRIA